MGDTTSGVVRRAELRRLLDALDATAEQIVELVGDPGSGKTRLIAELAGEARRRGFLTFGGRLSQRHQSLHQYHRTTDGSRRVLLTLDDFHWADTESVELIDRMTHWPLESPALIVLAYRPRQASMRLRSALAYGVETGTVLRTELGPLSAEQTAELLGLPADSPRLDRLYRTGEGNPLYLRVLAETEDEIPHQFAALMAGEIAELDEDELATATVAALLGERFDLAAVAEVGGLPESVAGDALTRLVRRDVLRPVNGTATFAFRHAVLRRLFCQHHDPLRRIETHRKALALLAGRGAPPVELAPHIENSLVHVTSEDLDVLVRAADDSEPSAAERWLRVALSTGLDRPRLRLELAKVLIRGGQLAAAREELAEVLRLVPEPGGQRLPAVVGSALAEAFLGRYADANTLVRVELAALAARDSPMVVDLLVVKAMIGLMDGALPTDARIAEALRVARGLGDPARLSAVLAVRGLCAASGGHAAVARAALAESAALINPLSDALVIEHPEFLLLLAWAETLLGLFSHAEGHFGRGLSLARERPAPFVHVMSLIGLSSDYRHIGRYGDAVRLARQAKEAATLLGAPPVVNLAISVESLSSALLSREAGAGGTLALAEQASGGQQGDKRHWFGVTAAMSLAQAAEMDGDPRRCIMLITDTGGGADLPNLPVIQRPKCYELLTASAVMAGDTAGAVDWARRADAAATVLGLPYQLAWATQARAHVLRDARDMDAATDTYLAAANGFASIGAIGSQATALVFAARCAEAAGRVADAESLLVLSKDLAHKCGATRLHGGPDDVPGPLRKWTVPPVDAALSVLTTREREIAGNAGSGMTTRSIASRLSLSPRTVDAHLTNIYRKLNVRSRVDLARLIAEGG
ncbi:LuxR family transcriptional regulator [Kutzneria sp. 744]|uniref:helix-turn-helix transcriptional regulator n=1 Tax=Kutzneria sp. (strain 744) TaxID=345341 RepID=UPI0003EEB6BC|nr:LuxR family transcriptional regulator [Kutzneria sp. 744]EWM18069.1 LigA protein [Kutzneria sp. 744]